MFFTWYACSRYQRPSLASRQENQFRGLRSSKLVSGFPTGQRFAAAHSSSFSITPNRVKIVVLGQHLSAVPNTPPGDNVHDSSRQIARFKNLVQIPSNERYFSEGTATTVLPTQSTGNTRERIQKRRIRRTQESDRCQPAHSSQSRYCGTADGCTAPFKFIRPSRVGKKPLDARADFLLGLSRSKAAASRCEISAPRCERFSAM